MADRYKAGNRGAGNGLQQALVFKPVPGNISNKQISDYCLAFGTVIAVSSPGQSHSDAVRIVFVEYDSKVALQRVMDARPHTILGRPVEVMRAYPRQSPVELKTLQVSRVSVAPMGNIRVCLDASKIGRYFEHPQFGAIYSVTPKNIEGDLFVDYQDYDSVDKALLAGEHVVGGVKLILTKEPADYWVRTNDMPLRMTVHELCGLVGNQPSSRILPGDVILHLDNGEAVIKNQNRQTMNEPRARSLANMWTISAVMAGCPLRFEAIRAQTSKNQLCVNFQNGRCQYTHTMCHWAHIDCPLQRNCREEQCGLGHPPERNIRGRIILNQDDERFRYRTKISNLPSDVKGIDIARSLLNLQHSRSIKIDRSDNLVCAYLWDQKSEQLARNQVYKWHGKRYEDQPIQCQLEMYDQSLFENSEEDSTLHQDDAVHPPSRSTVNHNNDGSLLEKNTKNMDDVPGRPDGLPARFQWTGERISAVDHRGQADVYKLVNRLDAQGFVIKMYKATDRADFRRRVHNEIIAIRRLNQQNVQSIPQLFETNVDPDSDRDKKLWAVMNYLGGYTLDKYVSRYTLSKLPLKAAISITRQLLSILKAVHTRGVVHRDLKPNNIMIDPETTTLTVIDFGMSFNQACEITDPLDNPDEEGTSIGVELGNRFFRPPQLESHVFSNSPEDLRQKRRNPKVDASMTGALLFWMITGWKPMVSKEKYGATFYRVPDCVALFERSIADAAPSMSDFLLREIENELSHYYLDDSRLQKKLRDRFNRTFEKAFADYDDQWTVDGLGERLAAIEEDLFEEEEHYHQVEKIIPGQVSNGSIPRSPVSRSFNSYHPLSPLAQSFATANRISPAPPAAKPASGRFSNDHSRDHEPRSGSTPSEDEWVTSEPRKSHQRRR